MSKSVDDGSVPHREALAALERAVAKALERLSDATRRADSAERRSADLNEIMARLTGNPAEAGEVLTRLKHLEDENADLRGRLDQGRAGVERLLAKVRFLENQR